MTIINVNSISGINSITAQGASGIEFFDSSGSSVQKVTGDGLTVGTGATISGSTNTITVSTNSEERVRITSTGDIGIANASPTKWGDGIPTIEIKGTVSSGGNSTRSGAIAFESGSGSNGYSLLWGQNGGIHIYTGATDRASATYAAQFNSSGNLAFASGNGIDFSATANGSGASNVSELLDDYEEGTFTPTFNTTNGNVGTISYDSANTRGEYVKIGRKVFITLVTRTTGISGSAGTGDVILSNLPFVPDNTVSPRPVCSISEIGSFGGWGTAPVTTSPPTIWGLNYIKLFAAVLSTANPGNFFMLSGTYVTTA